MVVDAEIVGTLQLTFIPSLTYRGGLRAQIEAVRIKKYSRGMGYGKQLINWAIKRSQDRGCHMVQLTTDEKNEERPSLSMKN